MEQAWERRPHAEVSFEEIESMVRAGMPHAQIASAERIETGKANTNFKVVLGDGSALLLRLHTSNPDGVPREHAAMMLVVSRVHVPKVLYSDLVLGYSLLEWIPGRLLESIEPEQAADVAFELGSTLARIGTFQFGQSGFLGPDLSVETPFSEITRALLDYTRENLSSEIARIRLGGDLADRTLRFVDENQWRLEPYANWSSLVHGDYKGSNLLISDGEPHVAAVLDWEFAHSGTPILDIGILLRHEEHWPARFADQFAAGFQEAGGFLADDWHTAIKLVDLANLADFANREHAGEAMVNDIRRLIRKTIDT